MTTVNSVTVQSDSETETMRPVFSLTYRMVKEAQDHVQRVDEVYVTEQAMQEALIKAIELAGYEVWR